MYSKLEVCTKPGLPGKNESKLSNGPSKADRIKIFNDGPRQADKKYKQTEPGKADRLTILVTSRVRLIKNINEPGRADKNIKRSSRADYKIKRSSRAKPTD